MSWKSIDEETPTCRLHCMASEAYPHMLPGYGIYYTSIDGKVNSVDTEYSQSHSQFLHLCISQGRPDSQNL